MEKIWQKIRFNLKIFFLYSYYSLKTTFKAQLGLIFFFVGKIIRFLFFLALIALIFQKIKIIKGYTIEQVMVFYLVFNLLDTLVQILFREVYRFRFQVISGSFNLILTKPHHPFLQILVGGVDFLDLVILIPYFLLFIFFVLKIPHFSFFSFLLFCLLIINSVIIATAFHILVLGMGILTTETDNTIMIYRDLTNMARFPLDIYKNPIKEILTFVIPIGVMITFPAQTLFGLLSFKNLLYALFISFFLLFFSLKFWQFSLKKYQSWGG